MIRPALRTLIDTLTHPARAADLSAAAWSSLIGVARATNLLGRLAARLEAAGVSPVEPARRHLAGSLALSARQQASVRWEVSELDRILSPLGVPVLLLKGAAYVMAGSPAREGRLFGDIDILVPHEALDEVEFALMREGWTTANPDPYDQRYYRAWMHELPPMTHVRRGTVLDIHHTILPRTARHAPDPTALISAALPVAGMRAIRRPASLDMLIHSITHLMHEGELHNGLRDLSDIDLLLHDLGDPGAAASQLAARAIELDLAGPVAQGIHLLHASFGSPVDPLPLLEAAGLGRGACDVLSARFLRAMAPERPDCRPPGAARARFEVYVRAHWLRMPAHLLAAHLTRKALRGLLPERGTDPDADAMPRQ